MNTELGTSMVKQCDRCKEAKSLDLFHKDKTKKDGKHNRCKACALLYSRERWAEKSELLKRQARDRYTKGCRRESFLKKMEDPKKREAHMKRVREYESRQDPAKARARQRVRQAILNGKMVRPDFCSVCGEREKVQGHHADYSKPLEVQWLCQKCHSRTHHNCL